MKVLEKGHVYLLENKALSSAMIADVDAGGRAMTPENKIVFVNQQPGQEHGGTLTQEVIRALLDRTRHCANCMPHPNNERIVYHLRMALVLHEARALERMVEKGELRPEYVPTVDGGHFDIPENSTEEMRSLAGEITPVLLPHPMDGAKEITHPTAPVERRVPRR